MIPSIPGISSGELTKFKITVMELRAGSDNANLVRDSFTEKGGDDNTFEVMFNPNTFSQNFSIESNEQSETGTESNRRTFNRLGVQSYTFEFLLDGTGASAPTIPGGVGIAIPGAEAIFKPPDVRDMIDNFMKVCYEINRDEHRPNYVLLSWGVLDEVCLLSTSEVRYTLFQPDGKPIRARINATFNKVTPQTAKLPRSADLTHIRAVSEGANLPLMSDQIYKEAGYYIQLARANKLKNFRRLRTGQNLNFPPIKNTSE